jgi:hypothetical protein
MKRGSKKNLPSLQDESEDKTPTVADIFRGCADLGEFTDLIDTSLEKAEQSKGAAKKKALVAVDEMMTFYEKHVRRKLYIHPI